MNKNKRGDMTPYDMNRLPKKQNPLLLPLVWGACKALTAGAEVDRSGIKGLKPPFLVFSAHQGSSDYYLLPRALFPRRATYVSDMEGFANYGKRLYSAIGCIGCRRFVSDTRLIRSIKRAAFVNKNVVVIFPEARHSDDGRSSPLPDSVGRLAALLKLPVVTAAVHGSYVKNPFWDEFNSRKSKLKVKLELVCAADEALALPADEIQRRVEKNLAYDEHAYMQEQGIEWSGDKLANGLEKPLFRCKRCGEKTVRSDGNDLVCSSCGARAKMQKNGTLILNGETVTVPEWYDCCRTITRRLIDEGAYKADYAVYVEALPSEKGFVPLGEGRLTHGERGFTLTLENGFVFKTPEALSTVQNEYNYQRRGECLVLSDRDCCYYIYPREPGFSTTEFRFAQEYFHEKRARHTNRAPAKT